MDPREINPQEYNKFLAEALKLIEQFKSPEWAFFVKTSPHKERPSIEPDFWYKRAASILKQFYLRGNVGVSRLRSRYGGRKNRGMRPEEFRKSGGKIIRVILQQAEAAGFLEKTDGEKSVRKISEKGMRFLEETADKISKSKLNEKEK